MKIIILVPTYNEEKNISRLFELTNSVLAGKDPNDEYVMLILDGKSTDSTVELVRESQKKYSWLQLLQEESKDGLGAAYIKGFKYVLENMRADVVIEMDADLQHDPKELLNFVNEIKKGADYVIGSRFIEGGSIPKDWQLYRKFLSFGGSIFIRLVLGLFKLTDFTTGYRATRVNGYLDKLNFDDVISKGFAYKIDLLYKLHKLGAKIVEIPIVFGLREEGISKMEKNNFLDSLRVVLMIRYRENKSFFRFVIVGFAGLFSDLFLANILKATALSPQFAASLAAFLAMTVTFTLNNFWSFSEKKANGILNIFKLYIPYVLLSTVPILFRFILVKNVVLRFGDGFIPYNVAIFIAVFFGLVWNYLTYSRIIWRK